MILLWKEKEALAARQVLAIQNSLNHKEKFLDTKRLAQQETCLQAHALEFPVMTTSNHNNRRMPGITMPAQNFVERHAVQIRQTDIQQDQVYPQFRQLIPGLLPITKNAQAPTSITLQYIVEQVKQLRIIFNDGNHRANLRRLLPINIH